MDVVVIKLVLRVDLLIRFIINEAERQIECFEPGELGEFGSSVRLSLPRSRVVAWVSWAVRIRRRAMAMPSFGSSAGCMYSLRSGSWLIVLFVEKA